MPKWLKTIVAILLLPFCVGAVRTLVRVLTLSGGAEYFWVAFGGGAACWLGVYLLLPRPMRVYVLGHELTHVLWTWLFGGRVRRLRVSSRGGHVVVTKSNFLIALSPYFFPFYAVLVVAVFGAGHVIWGWERHLVWFHLFLGAAYAFHLTLTWHVLQMSQSDITGQGYLFSAVIIFLGNITVLLVGIPLLTDEVSLASAMGLWLQETGSVVMRLRGLF